MQLIDAGEMRERIYIQQLVDGERDEFGAPTRTWVDTQPMFAQVLSTGGEEFQADSATHTDAFWTVQHWLIASLNEKQRYRWGSKILNIVNLGQDPTLRQQSAMCRERVAE